MKRAILIIILVGAGFGGGVLLTTHREAAAPSEPEHEAAARKPAEAGAAAAQLSRDTNGNAVITLSEKSWKDLGLDLKSLAASQMSPELKGYGRVLDPMPLAALMTELATAEAAYVASSNELVRLKTLAGQGNASARSLQTAEAASQRDQVAVQSCKERITLLLGEGAANPKDLQDLVRSLISLKAALVRIDLPVGESLKEPPAAARIATPAGLSLEAELLAAAPSVDPQVQGHGYIFLVKPNSPPLAAGESVVGYLKVPGAPLAGVVVPRDAVVRTEGAGWVYVLTGDAFTRIEVALDRPTEAGWFVTRALNAGDRVVATGAQQLLSFELKGQGGEE